SLIILSVPVPLGLLERLNRGESVIVAEGYVFAFEKLCYIQAGPFVPEVVIEHPELVRQMYKDFVRAGSDVVQAFTYYASRSKMTLVSREKDLETINRRALKMAREVADETGTLMCGDICNTGEFVSGDEIRNDMVRDMFKEQVEWAASEGADFIVGETFVDYEEALIALKAIKQYGKGLPAVITLSVQVGRNDAGKLCTADGVEIIDALRRLEAAGADVVGLNCSRGPDTMLPLLKNARGAGIKAPLAALPVPYRTNKEEPTFFTLKDPRTGARCFPLDLDCRLCSRSDIIEFGQQCAQLGIQYVGLCCGNSPHFTRNLAESLGRKPEASRFSPNMSLHMVFGNDDSINKYTSDRPDTYLLENGK
ncbi:betaine--homocysteine S-methyltransferase 1-like, partial [Diadema antillarum]|uniref:betaine--homocysteine S-methyltransferase 1-like n=1 Tax=Diadema antillarum TaxID=105358 RepID=UPI003A86C5E5